MEKGLKKVGKVLGWDSYEGTHYVKHLQGRWSYLCRQYWTLIEGIVFNVIR